MKYQNEDRRNQYLKDQDTGKFWANTIIGVPLLILLIMAIVSSIASADDNENDSPGEAYYHYGDTTTRASDGSTITRYQDLTIDSRSGTSTIHYGDMSIRSDGVSCQTYKDMTLCN